MIENAHDITQLKHLMFIKDYFVAAIICVTANPVAVCLVSEISFYDMQPAKLSDFIKQEKYQQKFVPVFFC
jgi:hypothetical protein